MNLEIGLYVALYREVRSISRHLSEGVALNSGFFFGHEIAMYRNNDRDLSGFFCLFTLAKVSHVAEKVCRGPCGRFGEMVEEVCNEEEPEVERDEP